MRYRALSPTGDFTFGQGSANYLVDSSEAVAQACLTALKLFQGEWFLNTQAGMPWYQSVLGKYSQASYDAAIQTAIKGVQGVARIMSYSSALSIRTRLLMVNVTILTIYSQVPITFANVVPTYFPPGGGATPGQGGYGGDGYGTGGYGG